MTGQRDCFVFSSSSSSLSHHEEQPQGKCGTWLWLVRGVVLPVLLLLLLLLPCACSVLLWCCTVQYDTSN